MYALAYSRNDPTKHAHSSEHSRTVPRQDKIVSEGPPSVSERMYNPLHCSLRVLASEELARLIEGENAPSQKLVIEKKSWILSGNCHGAVGKWVYARSQFSSSRHAIWFLDEHLTSEFNLQTYIPCNGKMGPAVARDSSQVPRAIYEGRTRTPKIECRHMTRVELEIHRSMKM